MIPGTEIKRKVKHYSQTEAIAFKNKTVDLENTIDVFFDRYNQIRGELEGMLDSEIEVSGKILDELQSDDIISDPEHQEKIKYLHPEFIPVFSEYYKQLGRKEMIEFIKENFEKIFKPNQNHPHDY